MDRILAREVGIDVFSAAIPGLRFRPWEIGWGGQPGSIDLYLSTLHGRSQYTVDYYRDCLENLQSCLSVPLEEATISELHTALCLYSKRYKRSRLHGVKTALRGLLRTIGKKDWVDEFPNPRIRWIPPEGPKPDDIDRILKACKNGKERAVVLVSYSLGGRPGAIFGDKKICKPPALAENIDWEDGRIRVIDKGGYERVLVFQQRRNQTLKTLRRHLNGRAMGPIFDLTQHGAYKMLRRIGRRVGIKLSCDRMRHATGYNMGRQSGDFLLVGKQLNHSDPSSTLVYAEVLRSDLVARAREKEWR